MEKERGKEVNETLYERVREKITQPNQKRSRQTQHRKKIYKKDPETESATHNLQSHNHTSLFQYHKGENRCTEGET